MQILVVAEKKEMVIAQREILKLVVIERKSYEKLKERALEQYKKEETIAENLLVDEVVSFKYGQ
jgi:flagellar FliJ protein